MAINYRQIKAIEKRNKERILSVCPDAPEMSGIYILIREENGFRFAYIGQAKNILSRLAQHLSGYQHIDLSIKNMVYGVKTILADGISFGQCVLRKTLMKPNNITF